MGIQNCQFVPLKSVPEAPMIIIDPLNPDNNLAKNSFKAKEVFLLFKWAI